MIHNNITKIAYKRFTMILFTRIIWPASCGSCWFLKSLLKYFSNIELFDELYFKLSDYVCTPVAKG